jgi:outer membrane protein assembly factor BamB
MSALFQVRQAPRLKPYRKAVFCASVCAAFTLLMGLVACSTTPGPPRPTPLEALVKTQTQAQPIWRARLGASVSLFTPMVAVESGSVTAAADNGAVQVFDVDTGKTRWRAQAPARLSAGVGSDGAHTAVMTQANVLVVFDADGKPAWQRALPARVLTAPLVAGKRVFVLGLDRTVLAFDAQDGSPLWRFGGSSAGSDPLYLLQQGVLAVDTSAKDTLLVSQGPRLVGLDPSSGTPRWDVPLAVPRGANEIERMADLVGPAVQRGSQVCARAFQLAVACADVSRARLMWGQLQPGKQAVALDVQGRYVLAADASDRLRAFDAQSGKLLWSRDALMHRGLSAPLLFLPVSASVDDTLALWGDAQGYVHVLSAAKGQTVARWATDGSPVRLVRALSDSSVLVLTQAGGLFAFRPVN